MKGRTISRHKSWCLIFGKYLPDRVGDNETYLLQCHDNVTSSVHPCTSVRGTTLFGCFRSVPALIGPAPVFPVLPENVEPQNITLSKVNVQPCRRSVRGASPKAASIGPSVAPADGHQRRPQFGQDLCSRASQATPGNCRIERQIWTFYSQILKILKR